MKPNNPVYIKLCDEPIAKQTELVNGIVLDWTRDMKLVGIEILLDCEITESEATHE